MGFDRERFLSRAVQTPSHESVDEMRTLLVDALDALGESPTVDDAGSVIATKGEGTPHYVLNTHVDTVAPHVPYARDGDVVRGRGACDAKGPLTAFLAAYDAHTPSGRLTLAVTPDEETSSAGAHALDLATVGAGDPVDGVVVGEPTGLDVCHAARGRFEGRVEIRGTAAHAAEPQSGRNAVRGAASVLEALDTFDEASGPGTHEVLGAPTLTATGIEGGGARNQVPAACDVWFDRRSVPPESAEGFRADLERYLRRVGPADLDLSVTLTERGTPFLESFATPVADPLVRALATASGGRVRPFGAATEASYFAGRAPTVVFGPGVLADEEGPVAHADREYVRLSAVEAAADALTEALAALE